MRPLFLGLALVLATLPPALSRAEEITRIEQLREQIKATESLLEQSTRNSEKAQLQTRLDRLHREVENQEAGLRLQAREQELERSLAATPQSALRETLRRIDVSADHLKAEIARLDTEIGVLETQRDLLVEQRSGLRLDNEKQAALASELDERIINAREGLLALDLERDALNHELQLAQEVDRIDDRLKAYKTSDTPRLAELFQARSELRQRDKQIATEGALIANLQETRNVKTAWLELNRQKLAQIDEDISLLEKQTGLFNSNAAINRLLNTARSQKKFLDQRLTAVERQVAALSRSASAIARSSDLLAKEGSWLAVSYAELSARYSRRLLTPTLILLALAGIYFALSTVVLPRMKHRENLVIMRRFSRYLLLLAAVMVVGAFFFDDLRMFATTLGIVSAAIVIALQDVCAAVAGWVVIMTGTKFRIGDRIEIDGDCGDVIDIDLLRTTILEVNKGIDADHPTGRVIVLPNSFVLKGKVFNASHGHPFIWRRQVFTFTYETPWRDAEAMLQRVVAEETAADFEEARFAARQMERRYGVSDAEYVPKMIVRLADWGYEFTCLHVCHFRKIDAARTRIHRRVAAELDRDPRLQLAYPTQREIGGHYDPPKPLDGPAVSAVASVPAPGVATVTVSGHAGNGHSGTSAAATTPPARVSDGVPRAAK